MQTSGGEPSSGTHGFQTVFSQNWIVENETTAFSSDGVARPAGNCADADRCCIIAEDGPS
jgi:hypothetical protein